MLTRSAVAAALLLLASGPAGAGPVAVVLSRQAPVSPLVAAGLRPAAMPGLYAAPLLPVPLPALATLTQVLPAPAVAGRPAVAAQEVLLAGAEKLAQASPQGVQAAVLDSVFAGAASQGASGWERAEAVVLAASQRDAEPAAVHRELWVYGHSFPRHGPEVPDENVLKRLEKPRHGRATGLKLATKFSDQDSYVRSAQKAWAVLEDRLLRQADAKLLEALDQLLSGRIEVMPDIVYSMDQPVGYGYARTPRGPERVDGLSKVCVKFSRHGSSDRLYIKTLYPVLP